MSALERSAISARLAKLPMMPPPLPPGSNDEEDEEEEELDDLGSLPTSLGTSKPPYSAKKRAEVNAPPNPAYAPISASDYFAQALQVPVIPSGLDFRVYYTPPITKEGEGTSVMVCHHGAGYSGLSFALLAKEVYEATGGELGVLSIDARAHGKTSVLLGTGQNPPELDLSLGRLSVDFQIIVSTIFPDPKTAPHLLLVGHSMGGAVLVDASAVIINMGYHVTGVAVLDVVEGSAIDALPHMHALLATRPDGFQSQERAIQWHVEGNYIRNPLSARISVPPLLVPADETKSETAGTFTWEWRAPLKSTTPFWMSWFSGLSAKFLAVRAARLLILAGTDRLDKTLMIGQMQGKFQLEVVPDVGHMLHEDNPPRLAQILIEFWRRNDRVVAGIKKVGEA